MDKDFYDYDYSEAKITPKQEVKPRSAKEVGSTLERFGFKTKLRSTQSPPMTPEQLQAEVMAEEKLKRQNI